MRAHELRLSRARVTQILRPPTLAPSVIETLEQLGDEWSSRIVGEHTLRGLVDLPEAGQLRGIEKLVKSLSTRGELTL